MQKTKMNYSDRLEWVRSVLKTRHDNNVTDDTSAVYAKMKLNCHDRSNKVTIGDENQTR